MFKKNKVPGNGETYHNSSYSHADAALTVRPSGSGYTYCKIYSGFTLVSCLFIHSGSDATVFLPAGSYTIKVASGSDWQGESELFGPDGSYSKLTDKYGSDTISLESGTHGTISLTRVSNGNVSSRSISRSDF